MGDTTNDDELTCPFCGQLFPVQNALTEHFTDDHGMDGF